MIKQPNSAHCFACGLENQFGLKLTFYSQGENQVICRYTIPEHFEGFPGVAHGGVIASILDEALVRSFMAGDPDRFTYTAKMTTRYRKPVPINMPLEIVGRVIKDRGRTGESKAQMFGPDGEVLAEAEALVVEYPNKDLAMERLGWKVYPDEEEKV
jgi:acyl-coenzyme A thioesterase PaaI-like protein